MYKQSMLKLVFWYLEEKEESHPPTVRKRSSLQRSRRRTRKPPLAYPTPLRELLWADPIALERFIHYSELYVSSTAKVINGEHLVGL